MVFEGRENNEDRDQINDNDTSDHGSGSGRSAKAENIRFLKMRLSKMIQERRNVLADTSFRSEMSENNAVDEGTTAEKSLGSNVSVPFLSPSGAESLGSSSSFPDRRKKKPKFQVMLERAREEENKKKEEGKKLYMRIQEKSMEDSDRDENEKIESSKKKKKPTIPTKTQKWNNGNAPEKARLVNNDPDFSSSDVENKDNNHRITKISSKKSSKQPLFQRLATQAKMEAEREAKDKLDKYNMIRLQKQAAKAPTREELKERERFLEAEMERNREQKNKKQANNSDSEHNSAEKNRVRRSLSQGNAPPLLPRDNSKPYDGSLDRSKVHTTQNEQKEVGLVDKKMRSGIPKFGRPSTDSNNRQVTYHDDATPLHPKGQPLEHVLQQHGISYLSSSVGGNNHPPILEKNPFDETGGLFSPISMTSMGGDSRYSSGNGKKLKGKFGIGNVMIQGNHLVDICGDGNDNDDDSGINANVMSTTTNVNDLRSNKVDGHVVAEMEAVKPNDETVEEQDCGSENDSNRSVFLLPDPPQVPVFGDQYVADVLETEEGEEDRAVLYAAGFSTYMETQGIIV